MGQESGEIWTAETRLQPILPKSDRLLGKLSADFQSKESLIGFGGREIDFGLRGFWNKFF
jgi:hypothetical protein